MKELINRLSLFNIKDTLLEDIVKVENNELMPNIIIKKLLSFAREYNVVGNVWKTYIAYYLLTNENAFSLSYEHNAHSNDSYYHLAKLDMCIIKELYGFDLKQTGLFDKATAEILADFNQKSISKRKYAGARVMTFAKNLELCEDANQMLDCTRDYYVNNGAGLLGLNKAFRIIQEKGENDCIPTGTDSSLQPIFNMENKTLSDLVGYEMQKQELVDNTEAFLNGQKSNNVLLYGDGGTGKSSSIKAIINRYADKGLKVIEVYKHQFIYINDIIRSIKERNYKFILFMDDLSFEEFEIEYKYLKAIIEGGLESKPSNVLIYATSNRRHIIRETWSDKQGRNEDNDLHRSDTMQEKLSLVARFGLTIYYENPSRKEFFNIVRELAKRNNVSLDENKLEILASRWDMEGRGKSGRSAEQFINYILSKNGDIL